MQLFGIWDVFTYSYKSNSHACTMYCISSTVVHVNGGGGGAKKVLLKPQ